METWKVAATNIHLKTAWNQTIGHLQEYTNQAPTEYK